MEKKQLMPYGTNVLIWLGLLVLTGTLMVVAGLRYGRWSIMATITIATVQGLLILHQFMKLKREGRLLKIMLSLALLTLSVIMVLTFAGVVIQ